MGRLAARAGPQAAVVRARRRPSIGRLPVPAACRCSSLLGSSRATPATWAPPSPTRRGCASAAAVAHAAVHLVLCCCRAARCGGSPHHANAAVCCPPCTASSQRSHPMPFALVLALHHTPPAPPLPTPHSQLDFQPGQGDYRVYIVNLDLARGGSYFMRIYATNGAGLEGYR